MNKEDSNPKPIFTENIVWSTKKKSLNKTKDFNEDSFNNDRLKHGIFSEKKCSVLKMTRKNSPPRSINLSNNKKTNYINDLTFETEVIQSPFYSPEKDESYIEQAFEIFSEIGSGSFGDVYKVKSRIDSKLYAIKRSRNMYMGLKHRNKMLEEVKTYFVLGSHSNLLNYVSSWEECGFLYIQTELCVMNLRTYSDCETECLSELCVYAICYQLCEGLEYIHSKEFVHLDIKPDNIFIGIDQKLKIGDLGIALNQKFNNNQLLYDDMDGEAKYIAPELLSGSFSILSDIFSFGLVLLEVVTDLELPSGGKLWDDLRSNNIPFHLIKYSNKFFHKLIENCLSKDSSIRPSSSHVKKIIQKELLDNIQNFHDKHNNNSNKHNFKTTTDPINQPIDVNLLQNFPFFSTDYISKFVNETDKRIKITIDHDQNVQRKRQLIKSKISFVTKNLFQDFNTDNNGPF